MRAQVLNKCADRAAFAAIVIVPSIKQLYKDPLCPLVIGRICRFKFSRPVQSKSNIVQLLAVAGSIDGRSFFRMLTRLNGILFRRKAEGIITHRVQYIESFLLFVAAVNI